MGKQSQLLITGFLSFICISALVSSDASGEAGKFLSTADFMKLAETSNVKYVITTSAELKEVPAAEYANQLWPLSGEPLVFPWAVRETQKKGNIQVIVMEYPFKEATMKLLEEAEPLFDAREYAKAREIYQRAVSSDPGCYVAQSHIGDTYLLAGNSAKALEHYRKTLDLNPNDYRAHFQAGGALARLRRYSDARTHYIRALAIRPRHDRILRDLKALAMDLGVTVDDRSFQPMALPRKEDERIAIYIHESDKRPYWLAYGLCKGVWLGEPTHRKVLTGDEAYQWSSTEETECLFNLVNYYRGLRDANLTEQDQEMERLWKISEDGYLDEFIIYEMGTRISPYTTLMVDERTQARMVDYVTKYVVISKK